MAAGLIFALTAGPASAATSSGSYDGCPYGAACIYKSSTPGSGIESGGIYYSYGAHNLSGQYGYHYVVNNQYGGAWVALCKGYNGTGGWLDVIYRAPAGGNFYLTPVNSIELGSGGSTWDTSCGGGPAGTP